MKKFILITILLFIITFANSNITELNFTTNTYQNIDTVAPLQDFNNPTFSSQKIPNDIYEKMLGNSIPLNCKSKVDINSLAYLKISYFGFDNEPHIGEMIVNEKLSNEILDIFKALYDIKYPIEKIKLIDEYGANDELSMSDNNTSCFCYRTISGTSSISNHSLGCAIDINPLYNPYVSGNTISPASGSIYANRYSSISYQINKDDRLYKLFISHGWSWGGDWKGKKDYQHFEKSL